MPSIPVHVPASPRRWRRPPPSAALLARLLVAAGVAVSCREATAPVAKPPFLAIIPRVNLEPGAVSAPVVAYRISMLSIPADFDTVVTVPVTDTLILSLPPSTYQVTLEGTGPTCPVRDGPIREAVLFDENTTSIVRYTIECRVPLTVRIVTEGVSPDDGFFYRLIDAAGVERVGLAGANDTLRFARLDAGEYRFALSHVAENCVISSDGGARKRVVVPPAGGLTVEVRVTCSDPAHRPRIVSLAGSYRDGSIGFIVRAVDPDRDIDRHFWDITDCQGTSVLPGGGARERPGRFLPALADSAFAIGAAEPGLSDESARERCIAVRVTDRGGNSSAVVERLIGGERGVAPRASTFNAVFVGQSAVRTLLAVDDPDGDHAGVFVAARLRDGTISGSYDGKPDYAIATTVGVAGVGVPDIPLGNGRPVFQDYLSIIIYLVDRAGNMTRLEDADLFR